MRVHIGRRLAVALLALTATLGFFVPAAAGQPSALSAIVTPTVLADQAIDYSGARPSTAEIRAKGYVGVIRYIGAAGDWRAMNSAELATYRAANLKVAVVYEHGNGSFWSGGYQSGLVVGRAARQYALALGWQGAVYIATDVDVPIGGLGTATEAYRGARDGLGDLPMGAYGGKALLRAVRDNLGTRYLWSSNATSWDHGVGLPVQIQQHYDQRPPIPATDVNDVFGQWGYWPSDPDAVALPTPAQIQGLLNTWGFNCGNSGVMDAPTFWCIADFQTRFHVDPIDGVWGPTTQAAAISWWTFLLSIPKPQTPEQAALAFIASCMQSSLVWGDNGPCTVIAQNLLLRAGYVVNNDGVYGFETAGAVATFQRDNHLPITAAVEPSTWASLTK